MAWLLYYLGRTIPTRPRLKKSHAIESTALPDYSPIDILEDVLHLHSRHTGEPLGRVKDLLLVGDGLLKKNAVSAGSHKCGLWLARNGYGSSIGAHCWSDVGDAGSEGTDGGSGREGDEDGGGCELHIWLRMLQVAERKKGMAQYRQKLPSPVGGILLRSSTRQLRNTSCAA